MAIILKHKFGRRAILRGMVQGVATTVALPILDCLLNSNGTALASGAPMPIRFGTWFWGLGHSPGFGVSGKGREIVLVREVAPLADVRKYMNCFDGFNSRTDGRPNLVHYTGIMACRTGDVPEGPSDIPAPSLDMLVADAIGGGTRFPLINVAAAGGVRSSYSARSKAQRNSAEPSPVGLYTQIFGPEFVDPNRADFKPDPAVMIEQSVLSSVNDRAKRLNKILGSSDRQRLEAHFTAIRQLELQLALRLEKPPANDACKPPAAPAEKGEKRQIVDDADSEINNVIERHKLLTQILVMGIACNQTKVFNTVFSIGGSELRRAGEADTHHTLSHIQAVDKKLGYQPDVAFFNIKSMEALAYFVGELAAIREGDGTILDNVLLMAHTDTNDAKVHAIDRLPVFTFGTAGGRLKNGLYVNGNGDPITRIGLTAMQVMGVPIDSWGAKSNMSSKPIQEILT